MIKSVKQILILKLEFDLGSEWTLATGFRHANRVFKSTTSSVLDDIDDDLKTVYEWVINMKLSTRYGNSVLQKNLLVEAHIKD